MCIVVKEETVELVLERGRGDECAFVRDGRYGLCDGGWRGVKEMTGENGRHLILL